ncbi:single-stranded DNA-binding protein [Amycolatopsis sp. NPDC047767]|uniref:single-stranded DNA-binding protein n=1 Tax=Amycolatopsis sp. NPDC047767 TaxID=3156765 RepID=UPI003457306E
MAGEPTITVVGNLTSDPELRFTTSGLAVTNLTVAQTPRVLDRTSGEWKDGETSFWRCNIWRKPGENAANSLNRGQRVIVQGRLRQRSWETRDGEKRTSMEIDVDEIGPSLKYAVAKVTKAPREGIPTQQSAEPAGDPWDTTSTPLDDLVAAADAPTF